MRGIRSRSGNISDKDKLVGFLYILMRDHLSCGKVQEIINDYLMESDKNCRMDFSNGWLAKYAQDIARRLTKKE